MTGAVRRGEAPPLLLLHGLGGSGGDWDGLERWLPRITIAPDAPYHGGRGAVGALTFPALANDALAAADGAGFDRFHAVGVSMGAATAMTLAALHPSRIVSMVLLAPAWLRERGPRNLRPLRRLGRTIATAGLERAWELVAGLPPVTDWSESDVAECRKRFMAADPSAVSRALAELPGELPLVPTGSGHRYETFVHTWSDDPVHPPDLARAVATAVGAKPPLVLERPKERDSEMELIAGWLLTRIEASEAARTLTE